MLESTRSHTVRYDLVSEQQEQQQSMRLSSHLFGVLNVFLFTYEMCVDKMYRQKCYMIETNVGRGPPPNLQILVRCRWATGSSWATGHRPGSTAPECLCWWEGEEMEFPGLKPRYKGGSIPAYSMGTHDVQEVHEEKSQRS